MDFSLSNEQMSSIVDNIISGICVFALTEGRNLVPVYLNEGLYRMLGYSHKELERMLKDIRRNIIPEDMAVFEQGLDDILKDDGAAEFEFRTVTGDGSIRWLQVRGNLYGKVEGYLLLAGVIIDCTERKSIEEELALQAERLNILSSSITEHLIDYNSRTDVMNIKLNHSAFHTGEIVVSDFMSGFDFRYVLPEDVPVLREVLEAARRTPMSDSIDFRSCFFEEDRSRYYWYRASITSVRGADGYVSRIVGRIVNIDEQKKKEMELRLRADKDALSGLYNKGAAQSLMKDLLEKCATENSLAALIMVDLDHFKSVNDTFGHSVGDSVIESAGRILSDSFKGRDIVGRIGGDEFLIFMMDIKGPGDAMGMARTLNRALTRTLESEEGSVTVTASIGITMCEAGCDFKTLYDRADHALYVTKETGRNGRTMYGEQMETQRS